MNRLNHMDGMQTIEALTDQDLVAKGIDLMGTEKSLSTVAGCSVRVISAVVNGQRGLPSEPIPGVNKTSRELILEALRRDGKVPPVRRGPGRLPQPGTTNLTLRLRPEEAEAFGATKERLSAAVETYLRVHRQRRGAQKRKRAAALAVPALPNGTVPVRCRIAPETLARMNEFLAQELQDTSLRAALLRAAVLHHLAPA